MLSPIIIYIGAGLFLCLFTLIIPIPVGIIMNNIGLHFFDPYTVLAMGGFYFFLASIGRIIAFRSHFKWKLIKNLLPGTILGGLVVTYLLTLIPEKVIIGILLSFAFFYVLQNIFSKKTDVVSVEKTAISGFVAGFSTGALSSAGGPGGTLRNAYLANHVGSLQELNAITAGISFFTALINTLFRVSVWDISWRFVIPFVVAFPLILLVNVLGKKILDRLDLKPQAFRPLINIMVLLSIVIILPTLF